MGATVMSIQTGWRQCSKCSCLWFTGNTTSKCPAGGAHGSALGGYGVSAPNTAPIPGQSNWRWCRKCQCMFFSGNATQGVCIAGGAHDKSQSGDYTVPTGYWGSWGGAEISAWRWCKKCEALFHPTSTSGKTCHAGLKHDGSQSGSYAVSIWLL